jgi:Fuc2NAc and GlcNAc transferase
VQLVFCFFIIFILSFFLSGIFRRYAIAKALLDKPNERSAHLEPTPRGGGLAFAFCFGLGLVLLMRLDIINPTLGWILIYPGLMIALTGFVDDYKNMTARWRLVFHFLFCSIALMYMGELSAIPLGMPFWLVNTIAVFYLVWLLNLYNFMDGIDGIASLEAISVCIAASLMYFYTGICHLQSFLWVIVVVVF